MTRGEASKFARSVSVECDAAAASLALLQKSLSTSIPKEEITRALNIQLQSLDSVHQTLSDLARVFAVLAESNRPPSEEIPLNALKAARQNRLRRRLNGEPDEENPGSVDLF